MSKSYLYLTREDTDGEYYRVVGLGRSRSRRYTTITLSFVRRGVVGTCTKRTQRRMGNQGLGTDILFRSHSRGYSSRVTSGHTIIYCLTNGILWQMEAPPPGLRKHTWVLVKQPGYSLGANITGPLRRRTFIFYFGESFAA